MIGVENDWDTVGWCDRTDVVCGGDGTLYRGVLVLVVDALASEVGSTTLGCLEDDWCLSIASSFERGNDGGGRGDIDCMILALHYLPGC
jgi:hypothetical protein